MSDAVYEIRNLYKTYKGKVAANNNINFDVYYGEILGLLGPNGAGKSTLVKQMVGQLKPSAGTISLFGMDVAKEAKKVSRLVGYYSQEPHSMSSLSVEEAIFFTGRLRGMNFQDAKRDTSYWIERLELGDVYNKQLKRISGGQRRLAGIATTMIGSQPILIFDEPTNELDPLKRKLVWDTIRERNREHGATIILVTHNTFEAEHIVDRVGVVSDGNMLTIGAVGELKKQVDQRLKIDLSIKIGQRERAQQLLSDWSYPVEVLGENQLRLSLTREESSDKLQQISQYMEKLECEEYRVIPPSLEDVYVHFGGKKVGAR
ncbi:ATP-binding cassette domain-containing protein [Metabacillus fastidiosus]|uniref:ABC transporter ATP-binding protein n=1 Tax=Metabacillus fastidiosus TaxID=1458 RepID=UPI003D2E69C5